MAGGAVPMAGGVWLCITGLSLITGITGPVDGCATFRYICYYTPYCYKVLSYTQ